MPEPKPSPRPQGHPHPHDSHPQEHPCPDHYHRCHATFHGYIDCPEPHEHKPDRVTKLLKVPCGAQDPSPQIQSFLAAPANGHPLVTSIIDMAHDGWLIVFSVDA